jgi:hypothetical protein
MNSDNNPETDNGKVLFRRVVIFSPLLLLYITMAIVGAHLLGAWDKPIGDEARYLHYADNLLHGFYTNAEDPYLANGPGYPLVLTPLVLLGVNPAWGKLLNALFLFCTILYFNATMLRWVGAKTSVIATWILGLHFPLLTHLPFLYTESLTALQVTAFSYHMVMCCKADKSRLHGLAAAAWLMSLALTKVFFGYVLLFSLLSLIIWWAFTRKEHLRRPVYIFALALLGCLPYLTYTYSLTGKFFYWSSYGGASIYWMSSPLKGDHGDWMGNRYEQVAKRARDRNAPQLLEYHGPFFASLEELDHVAKDEAFKARAIQNITSHPTAFLGNWLANIGRLLFEYPYSHLPQNLATYLIMLPNSFLFVGLVMAIPITFSKRKEIPDSMRVLLLFTFFSFGGTSLLSAYFRQLIPIIPILYLWVSYCLSFFLSKDQNKSNCPPVCSSES